MLNDVEGDADSSKRFLLREHDSHASYRFDSPPWRRSSVDRQIFDRNYTRGELKDFLQRHCRDLPGVSSLTPEIKLKLLHYTGGGLFAGDSSDEDLVRWSLQNPYSWQCYWPGGQGLARYILDHPLVVKGKRVLEIGSGCGAVAIACAIAGASEVVGSDIDPLAVVSTESNAYLNGVDEVVLTTEENLLHRYSSAISLSSTSSTTELENLGVRNLVESCVDASGTRSPFPDLAEERWNVVVLGDMQYNDDLARRVSFWTRQLFRAGVEVLFGDPGRTTVDEAFLHEFSEEVESFDLPAIARRSHVNPDRTSVWRIKK